MAGKLVMIVGPMYSGKTTELLNFVDIYKRGDRKYKLFKTDKDKRYSEIEVVSHTGIKEKAVVVKDSKEMFNLAKTSNAIFIDEIQFFDENIISIIKETLRCGIDVYCSGIDISFKDNPFDITGKLLCLADEIIKKKAVCGECKNYNANITHRKTGNNVESEIDIGGTDKYVSVCRRCYYNLN